MLPLSGGHASIRGHVHRGSDGAIELNQIRSAAGRMGNQEYKSQLQEIEVNMHTFWTFRIQRLLT